MDYRATVPTELPKQYSTAPQASQQMQYGLGAPAGQQMYAGEAAQAGPQNQYGMPTTTPTSQPRQYATASQIPHPGQYVTPSPTPQPGQYDMPAAPPRPMQYGAAAPSTQYMQGAAGQAQEARKEITIKFSAKLVSEPFIAKDGNAYVSIKIPNRDSDDKSPWASFVLPAKNMHPDKFGGKGMWAKIPENGSTTIRKDKYIGYDENHKNVYETEKTRVPNRYLKSMVEFYKDRAREEVRGGGGQAAPAAAAVGMERPSLKGRLAEKKDASEKMFMVTGVNNMARPKEAAL